MPHHHSDEEKRCFPRGPSPEVLLIGSSNSTSRNPFTEGSTLSLIVEHGCDIPASLRVEATVIKLIQPVTTSPVIEVMLQMKSGRETKAVLKLYDRRFAAGLRRRERVQPWTPTTEELYKQYVLQGRQRSSSKTSMSPRTTREAAMILTATTRKNAIPT